MDARRFTDTGKVRFIMNNINNHGKKMVAPILIAALFLLYYGGIFLLCLFIPIPAAAKLLFVIVPLLLIGVVIYVLTVRIKEIRSGEEDDLSKY